MKDASPFTLSKEIEMVRNDVQCSTLCYCLFCLVPGGGGGIESRERFSSMSSSKAARVCLRVHMGYENEKKSSLSQVLYVLFSVLSDRLQSLFSFPFVSLSTILSDFHLFLSLTSGRMRP